MFGTHPFFGIVLLSLSLVNVIHAQNVANKKVLFPNGLGGINKQGLFNAYPLTKVTKKVKKPWGSVPRFCYSAANPSNAASGGQYCNPYDIEVYDVTFADCNGAPWTLCRCNNAPWTYNDMINVFSRVPVKARQYTQTLAMYGDTGTSAYSASQCIAIFDNAKKGGIDMTLILHENAHTVDGGSGGLSGNQSYVNAIKKDTCVPDNYAKSDNAENWAQLSVLSNYDLSKTGPLSKYANPACLSNQLKYVEKTLGKNKLVPGGTCDFTYARDPYVCMGPSAGCGRAGTPVASPKTSAAFETSDNQVVTVEPPQWAPIHDAGEDLKTGEH